MPTLDFNAQEVEPSTGFAPIPAGEYVAVITDSEMKSTKNGNGQYLQLEFEIVEGEFSSRKLWSRLNLDNPNSEAVKIARADLSAICRAVNVMVLKDTIELHNLPLVITVRCKKDSGSDEIRNEIKSYKSRAVGGATQAPPPAQATNAAPPWARNK